jgi:hypothetical protein
MKKRLATTHGVQMFSFLDAMICTLGALLVLLHAFARHGQIEAVRKAEAKAARESRQDTAADLELLKWRIEQLKLVREKTEAQLAEERLKLAHIEDHQRRLEEKSRRLQADAAQMARLSRDSSDEQLRESGALEDVRQKVALAREALAKARQQNARPSAYSVVPYEGPNGTRRRPIYIECRDDAMILQPEGVELTPADFAGFLGSGNPLASALRGTREYYARRSSDGKPDGEPYPLLLVRPEGVTTYYAARTALASWGSDFGYELIGSDWQLKFSEPDERLAELLRQIVADARLRMRELAVAMSELNAHRSGVRLHASSRGGFVVEGSPYGGGRGATGRHRGEKTGWDSLDSQWADGGGNGDDAPGEPGTRRGAAHAGTAGTSNVGPAGRGNSPGNPYGVDGTSPGEQASNGQHGGQTARQQGSPEGDPTSSGGTAQGDSPRAGQMAGSPGGSASSMANGSSAGSAMGNSGDSSQQSASMNTTHSSSANAHRPDSLAKVRGRDWGLPDSGMGMSPATRPILVECHPDRLVIVSDNRNVPPKVTRLSPEAQENIDEFVSNVWEHMKGWGIAGRGLYWRPTLVVAIAPGAADRYAEVKSLLADSGLDMRERQPRAANSSGITTRK